MKLTIALVSVVGLCLTLESQAHAEVLFSEDFESGLDQWHNRTSVEVELDEDPFEGLYCGTLSLPSTGSNCPITVQSIAVVPGQTYSLEVAYRTRGGGGYIGVDELDQDGARVKTQWFFGDTFRVGNLISLWDYNFDDPDRDPADLNVWKVYQQDYVPPEGIHFVKIKIQDYSGGLREGPPGDVCFDNILFALANQDPIADAGPDQTLECSGELTVVSLDGTGSFDPDDDTLEYEWSVPDGVLLDDPTSSTPSGLFPMGPTLVTLTVTDGKGGLHVDDVLITVQDSQPPVVVCTTDTAALWPPNGQMVDVAICVEASDACANPEELLVHCTVSSSEPDDGTGDGASVGDVDELDGYTSPVTVQLDYDPISACYYGTVALRAERDGNEAGRTYSIVTQVMDASGNFATASCVVVVPHDKRRNN